jgi:uncharacterized protein YlxP (DUF503 family)
MSHLTKRQENAYILFMSVELMISDSNSLKTKRRVVKSIIDKLRHKFNLSVAEIDYLELWQRALIGITMVSNNKRLIGRSADAIESFLREFYEVQLLDITVEVF